MIHRADSKTAQRLRIAAYVLLTASGLAACANAPDGQTQLEWPVGTTYTVRDGDSLSEIAENYGTSEAELARYNGVSRRDRIYAGQVLRIPHSHETYRDVPVPAPRPDARIARREHREMPRPERRPAERGPTRHIEHQPAQYASRSPQEPSADAPHFLWPVNGHVISSFGQTGNGGRNDGINIETKLGAPIKAAASGTVIYAGDELKGYGNLVLIRHEDGYITAYAHAEKIAVARDSHVAAGEVIGYAGESGNVSVPQVHFEIRRGVHPVNPAPLLAGVAS